MKYLIIGIIIVIAILVFVLNRLGSAGPRDGSPDGAPGHQYLQYRRDGGSGGGDGA